MQSVVHLIHTNTVTGHNKKSTMRQVFTAFMRVELGQQG